MPAGSGGVSICAMMPTNVFEVKRQEAQWGVALHSYQPFSVDRTAAAFCSEHSLDRSLRPPYDPRVFSV